MTLATRVIACLDIDAGRVVKGTQFKNLVDAGDPVQLAAAYERAGVDELVLLDVSASVEGRRTMFEVVRAAAEQVFIPLSVGGGVRSVEDMDALLRSGADKVGVNSGAVARPELLREGAQRFGAQCIVLSLDSRRSPDAPSGFEVTTHGGRRSAGRDALEWVQQAEQLGAGEILLNSVDADGTRSGFDVEMIRAVREVVSVPLIASGGAGAAQHFPPAVDAGADAVLAAGIFHFGVTSVREVKGVLAEEGVSVR